MVKRTYSTEKSGNALPNRRNPRDKETVGILRALALLTQIGLSIVVPLVGLVWLGQLLGSFLGAETFFLIISILVGLGAGMLLAYRLLFREME